MNKKNTLLLWLSSLFLGCTLCHGIDVDVHAEMLPAVSCRIESQSSFHINKTRNEVNGKKIIVPNIIDVVVDYNRFNGFDLVISTDENNFVPTSDFSFAHIQHPQEKIPCEFQLESEQIIKDSGVTFYQFIPEQTPTPLCEEKISLDLVIRGDQLDSGVFTGLYSAKFYVNLIIKN